MDSYFVSGKLGLLVLDFEVRENLEHRFLLIFSYLGLSSLNVGVHLIIFKSDYMEVLGTGILEVYSAHLLN